MEHRENKPSKEKKMLVFVVILVLANLITFFFFMRNNAKMEQLQVEREMLLTEQNTLRADLEKALGDFDLMQTDNAELQAKIAEQKAQIEKQLKELARSQQDLKFLKSLKDKVKAYDQIILDYRSEIEALRLENERLNADNKNLSEQNEVLKEEGETLKKDRDSLKKRVDAGSTLQAYDFNITGLRVKEGSSKQSPTNKAPKVNAVKACFVIAENKIAEAGERDVFMRLLDPSGNVLNPSAGNPEKFQTQQGSSVNYTEKRRVEYRNQILDVCVFWSPYEPMTKGTYVVEIWAEGKLIGKDALILK
jgi:FtsZ-binding cell division protein ZapB